MAQYETEQERIESRKELQETNDRITNAWHVQLEHFSSHQTVEEIQEEGSSSVFQCDRLLKMENSFIQMQLGYHPEQRRTFIFANTKTSRYDTISSNKDRKVRANVVKNMMTRKKKKQEGNGRKLAEAMIFLHNREHLIWSKGTIRSFLRESNEEVLEKTLPFFAIRPEKERQEELRNTLAESRKMVAKNSRENDYKSNVELHREIREYLQEENYLQMLITRKETASNYFMRKINYSIDTQKKEMFNYYKAKREEAMESKVPVESSDEDEDE
ncbi:MAG: hypothetical protein R3Y24_08915 [Eubacteriales bacterium]